MKILCDKCGKDITLAVNQQFEKNEVGKPICPHCKKEQKRYLSEADLLMYLAFSEVSYFILSFVTVILFRLFGISLISGIIPLILFALAIYLTGKFKADLYEKGFLKQETMYIQQEEDAQRVSRSIRWQFLLFFALVITFFIEDVAFWFFVAASAFAAGITTLKAILAAKKEIQNNAK